jgi:predicted RNA-binding protein with TRAM domain
VITLEKNIPVEKNKSYEVDIIGLGHDGEGVGKVEDFTVFVSGALPGEKVNAKILGVVLNKIDISRKSYYGYYYDGYYGKEEGKHAKKNKKVLEAKKKAPTV